jgi:DNA-binding transcriptional ArsR family regulator
MDARGTARFFAAVGDPTRLRLLRFLLDDEHCVSQCTEYIGLTQGAVSKQLSVLADAGLLTRRRASRRIYYQVKAPETLTRLLADAETLTTDRDGEGQQPVRFSHQL